MSPGFACRASALLPESIPLNRLVKRRLRGDEETVTRHLKVNGNRVAGLLLFGVEGSPEGIPRKVHVPRRPGRVKTEHRGHEGLLWHRWQSMHGTRNHLVVRLRLSNLEGDDDLRPKPSVR